MNEGRKYFRDKRDGRVREINGLALTDTLRTYESHEEVEVITLHELATMKERMMREALEEATGLKESLVRKITRGLDYSELSFGTIAMLQGVEEYYEAVRALAEKG